jgi:hypothetical protein
LERYHVPRFRLVLVVVVAFVLAPPTTGVASTDLDADLATLWTKVLVTPSAQNSFGNGGLAYACWDLGNGTVAPFAADAVKSCTVAPGTSIFVAASSWECSTFERDPKGRLHDCAVQRDLQVAPSVTVDGARVPVTEAETGLLNLVLPADNVFGLAAGTTGYSYGHGWVTLLSPLALGTHKIIITLPSNVISTLIKVQ